MEKSIFLKAYGDNPKLRVIDFLITFQEYDYSMKEIAKNAEIGYTTLKQFWPEFIKREIVIQTRIVGKAKMFKLNINNSEIQLFMKFYWKVINRETEKLLKKETKEIAVKY